MLNRAAPFLLALLLAFASALSATPPAQAVGAKPCAAAGPRASCCGGECRCGDSCRCTANDAPGSRDDSPALPERVRGERTPLMAIPVASVTAVTLADPCDLGAPAGTPGQLPATPSCRLRLALFSRWTT